MMQQNGIIKQAIVHRLETAKSTLEFEQLANGTVRLRVTEFYTDVSGGMEAESIAEAILAPEFVKAMADLFDTFKEMII